MKYCDTCSSASRSQRPNQSTTQRLNSAGEVAARSRKSPLAGFIVNTTCRLRCTRAVNHRNSSSLVSISRPSCAAASRQPAISDSMSSPSYSPGTSPLASSAFMRSKKPVLRMLDSSKMKQVGSPSTPAARITCRRSSSKLSRLYRRLSLIWNTFIPFSHATKRVSTVLPAPLSPTSSRWPSDWRSTRSMRTTCSSTSSNSTSGTFSSSSLNTRSRLSRYARSDARSTLL